MEKKLICDPSLLTPNKNTESAVRDILDNGILVETGQGLVCMSLKDALNQGVGGLTFSEEDFHNMATKLLTQTSEPKNIHVIDPPRPRIQGPTLVKTTIINKQPVKIIKMPPSTSEIINKPVTINHRVKMDNTHLVTRESILKFETPTKNDISNVVIAKYNYENETIVKKDATNVMLSKYKTILPPLVKPVYPQSTNPMLLITKKGRPQNTFNILSDNSELTMNSLAIKVRKYETEDVETSDNSDFAFSMSTTDSGVSSDVKPKKRGGWPKGRKRKPENEIRPPKAPATGYVLFLNEKRKDYKDKPFTEVTKLLGNEWSKLSLQDKKIYLDQAELDKRRYREELKAYRQSDAYRNYLLKKRMKRLQGNGTEESDMDATDEIDDEDNEELYCRLCDQWFHSLHNKKEHLYGRQHLQSIAGRAATEQLTDPSMSSTSLDESSLDGCSFVASGSSKKEICKKTDCCDSLNIDDAIVRFMTVNKDREDERKMLRTKIEEARLKNSILNQQSSALDHRLASLKRTLAEERQLHSEIEQKLYSLLNDAYLNDTFQNNQSK